MPSVTATLERLTAFGAGYLPAWFGRRVIRQFNRLSAGRVPTDAGIFDLFFAIGRPSGSVRTICDVGANVGRLTTQFHLYYPDAQIFCFEPQSQAYDQLRRTLSVPPFAEAVAAKQIQLFNQGLYSTAMDLDLHLLAHPDSSSIYPVTAERYALAPKLYETVGVERVSMIPLDQFASLNGLSHVDILKIDVEGAYLDVLKGAKSTLQRTDVVCIEMDFVCKDRKSRDWIDAVGLLHDSGLYLTSLHAGGNFAEVLTIRAAWDLLRRDRMPPSARTHAIDCIFQRL